MSAALTTNVDQRALRTTKFPPEFNVKVDMRKVNAQLIKNWVTEEISKLLKSEDDVVTELVSNILDENRFPNIKELQISLTGFLDKDAAPFCQTLWKLCLSAQSNEHGIPKELLEAKKAELAKEREEETRAREEAMKRQEADREHDRDIARIRDRERSERGRGRGGRGGRDFDRRPARDSRSPPRHRRNDDDYRRPPPGRADTYIPNKSRQDDRAPRRRRSPSYERSPSRSRSPPRRRRRYNESRSRSPPPRKRRNTSSERSDSRHRYGRNGNRRNGGNDRRKRRSPSYGRLSRSPPPVRRRHQSSSPSDRSRSPPPKRTRKTSPTLSHPSASDSKSPATPQESPEYRIKGMALAKDDLMSTNRRKEAFGHDARRLSRETSSVSIQSETTGGAVETAKHPISTPRLPAQQHLANQLREIDLENQLLMRRLLNKSGSIAEIPR